MSKKKKDDVIKKNIITKDEAKNLTDRVWNLLYEVTQLSEVIDNLSDGHNHTDECPINNQVSVLRNVVDDKLYEAFEAINVVDDYFAQEQKLLAQSVNKLEAA